MGAGVLMQGAWPCVAVLVLLACCLLLARWCGAGGHRHGCA